MAKVQTFPIQSNVMFSKYKAVGIKFPNYGNLDGKQYTIFTDIDVKVDDYVVADTTNGPAVAVVTQTTGLTKFDRDKANRLIISKINMKKVQKKYDAMVQLQELRQQLQERKEEMEEMAVLRLLAQTDPHAKKMMDDLFKLTGDITYQITNEKEKDGN